MAVVNIKAVFQSDVQTVWEIVTSLQDYSWRSDLERIDILNKKQFVEYTKDGYDTSFTITAMEYCKRWEFDMENSNMKGHWSGVFSKVDGGTEIDFTEDVTTKKIFLKPFIKAFLKKQQKCYVKDLKHELERKR